jgi:hypothetical protein
MAHDAGLRGGDGLPSGRIRWTGHVLIEPATLGSRVNTRGEMRKGLTLPRG